MVDAGINPLGLTAEAYAEGCVRAGGTLAAGGRAGALERYARLYREGAGAEGLVAPVRRVHDSESHEGTVRKFTQVVGPAFGHRDSAFGAGGSAVSVGVSVHGLEARAPRSAGDGSGLVLETESVLIPMIGKKRVRTYTLCVSSQVGCAMGCTFCQTAQMGLIRSLTPAEIVQQWFAAEHLVGKPDASAAITNIVFMGMGEPLDNLESVLGAIEVLTDRRGPSVAMSRVTISTVGRVDGIAKLAERAREPGWRRLGLAVSLNAPNDQVRSELMPINRAVPLAVLRRGLEAWPLRASGHMLIEYVLIPGVNDLPGHAEMVASFVLGSGYRGAGAVASGGGAGGVGEVEVPRYAGPPLKGLVNLIPYNPRERSPWRAPSEDEVDVFMANLQAQGVYVKRRRTKGRDQMAACGQLGNAALTRAAAKAAGLGTGR
jgi:23S rRNA (adenine2503-C2)-methyltransferase